MEFDPPFFFFHFFAMASSDFDIRILSSDLKFVPVETRMPLKFGAEVLTSVTCARVRLGAGQGWKRIVRLGRDTVERSVGLAFVRWLWGASGCLA